MKKPSSQKSFSQATDKKPRGRPRKGANEASVSGAKTVFNAHAVSKKNRDKISATLKKAQVRGDFSFTPENPVKFTAGKTYIHPGLGAMKFLGEESQTVAGYKLDVYVFQQLFVSNPAKKSIPKMKMKDIGMRLPVTREQMDHLVGIVKERKTTISKLPKIYTQRKAALESLIASSDPSMLAQTLCLCFGSEKADEQSQKLTTQYGNQAIALLATELAAVKGMNYQEAHGLLSRLSGKPGIDRLSGYEELPPGVIIK